MGSPVHALTTSGTGTGSGSAFTIPSLPSGYLDDDVICILFSNDGAGATLDLSAGSKTAGWATSSGTSGNTPAGEANCVLTYIKASGVVSAPSFVCSNTGVIYSIFVLRDIDPTTQIDIASSNASGTKDWTAANSAAAATVGAASGTDSLAIYAWCVDAGQFLKTKLDDGVCIAKYVSTAGVVAHIITYQQLSSTTVPAPTMYTTSAANGGNRWTVVFKNKSGGALAPQLRGSMTETDSGKLPNWYGDFGAQHNAPTWQAPSNFAATINGVTVSTNAPTVTNATAIAAVPWGLATDIANGTNANEMTGGTHAITSASYAGKTLAFTWAIGGQNSSGSRINTDGVLFGLSDGTRWSVWQLASKAKGWTAGEGYCAVIDLSTATPLYTSGTLDLTAVTRVAYLWHRASGSATADSFRIMNMSVIDQEVITGGGSSQPLSFYDYWFMSQSWSHLKLVPLQGSGQALCKYSAQIGDGTNVTYFDSAAQSFETPQAYSLTSSVNWQQDWNAGNSAITLNIKASTSDTINLASGVAATSTSQALTIDAASGIPSAYSFAQSFVGWTVTDSKGLSWNGATIKDGGTFTLAGGGDMTNCSITQTTSTNAALAITADNSVLTGCTIDGTGAAYALELGTSVTAITLASCSLTAGSLTPFDKIHVLKATGTVVITISGTTSLAAGEVTSAGATVTIAAPEPTLSATVLSGSRVVLYNNTTTTELDNTAPAGTSWSKVITSGASANDSLTLHVFKEGYAEFSTTFLYTGADATILVTQAADANLTSLRTELGITDYTTITEFALDVTGTVEVDADDADGSTLKARLAIWYNGVLTTENGARYLRGAITILSTAAFRINVDVLDLQVTNISVTKGLQFTDTERRLYRSDGTPVYSSTSVAGSIQNDYSGVPDTVETGVSGLTGSESAQLMGLPSAATIVATAVDGTVTLAESLRLSNAVLGGKVSGAGTTTETFRDLADTKDRAVFTVDSSGNRTAVTRDLT